MSATSAPPAKPWERAGVSPAANTVGVPKPWEQPPNEAANAANAAAAEAAIISRPQGARPWERPDDPANVATTTGGVYGPGLDNNNGLINNSYGSPYGTGYNSGMYGNSYGSGMYGGSSMYGNTYGMSGMSGISGMSGMYGSSMYGGGYGGGMYGSYRPGAYGSSMYGGGMYGGGMGMPGQAPGMGMDPNAPMRPPTAWQTFLNIFNGFMNYCGRLSFLMSENTQAFHFLISALLQFLDRAGSLYAEMARFVLRILLHRWGRKDVTAQGPAGHGIAQAQIQAPPPAAGPTAPSSALSTIVAAAGGAAATAGAAGVQWESLWSN